MQLRSLIFVLCLSALTTARANLLLNGGFETTVPGTSTGNNVGTVPPNWTVFEGAGYSNLQVGNAAGVGGYSLAPHTGGQFFDGTGTGSFPNPEIHVYQDFTVTVGGLLEISAFFGGRDTGSNTTPSFYAILTTTNTVLYTGSNVTVAPEAWVEEKETTSIYFGPGTYRFAISLSDPMNVDDVSIIVVPEPSTYATAALLVGLIGYQTIRRQRRKGRTLPDAQAGF